MESFTSSFESATSKFDRAHQRLATLKIDRKLFITLLAFINILWPLGLHTLLPALPAIGDEFNAAAEWVQFSILMYLVVVIVSQPVGIYLANMYGRRPITIFGLLIFTVFGIGCIFPPNIVVLNICRMFQGIGGGLFFATAKLMANDVFLMDDTRSKGILNGSTPAAMILAVLFGSLLVYYSDWRAIFVFMSLLSLITTIAIYFKMPETHVLIARSAAAASEVDVLIAKEDTGEENAEDDDDEEEYEEEEESVYGFDLPTPSASSGSTSRALADFSLRKTWKFGHVLSDYIFMNFSICRVLYCILFLVFICDWPFIAARIYNLNEIQIGGYIVLVIFAQILGSVLFAVCNLCFRVTHYPQQEQPRSVMRAHTNSEAPSNVMVEYMEVPVEKKHILLDQHHARIIQASGVIIFIAALFALLSPFFSKKNGQAALGENPIRRNLLNWSATELFYDESLWYLSMVIPMVIIQVSRGLSLISLQTIADEPYPTKSLKVETTSKLFTLALPAFIVIVFMQVVEAGVSTALFSLDAGVAGIIIFVCIVCVSTESILNRMKTSRKERNIAGYENEVVGSIDMVIEQRDRTSDASPNVVGMRFMNLVTEYDSMNPQSRKYSDYRTF